MVKKKKQTDKVITPSGHEADPDLARATIKVSPSLQALVANQVELLEMALGKVSRDPIFADQHKLELLQVEEEIALAFAGYMSKKEKARARRRQKQEQAAMDGPGYGVEHEQPGEDAGAPGGWQEEFTPRQTWHRDVPGPEDIPFDLLPDENTPTPSAVLPAAGDDAGRAMVRDKAAEPDVRSIALGASIKALQDFLRRELTEVEMQSLERRVDAYLS